MNKHLRLSLFIILLASSEVFGAFQDIGTGARPLGMGGAFVAIADDANTVLYNMAGLTQLESSEFTAMYAALFQGMQEDNIGNSFVSYAMPAGKFGTFGLSGLMLGSNLYSENIFTLSFAISSHSQTGRLQSGQHLQ